MDLLTTFVADAAHRKFTSPPTITGGYDTNTTTTTKTAVSIDNNNGDNGRVYNENLHKYMKQHIPNTYKYVAVLSMPVAAMFITISWKDNAMLFKVLITILIVIHVVLVSNFIEYSSAQ